MANNFNVKAAKLTRLSCEIKCMNKNVQMNTL